jgi:hypothetical protein
MTDTPETNAAEFPCMRWLSRDDPMGVRSSLAKRLERERDEAREKIEFSREWSAAIADIADDLRSELAAVTEQRDRLAEALRKAISWGDSASHHILYREDINWTYLDEAKEALQSLTTNEL